METKLNPGDRVGSLQIIEPLSKYKQTTKWRCKCDCGIEVAMLDSRLLGGEVLSCGCKKPSRTKVTKKLWSAMIHRCHYAAEGTDAFNCYRGRGIRVCDRWLNSFEDFARDMGDRPRGMSIDRIDVNGDYTPENTRWACKKIQSRNQRRYLGKVWVDWWLIPQLPSRICSSIRSLVTELSAIPMKSSYP
jgi:hypothetical protein